MRTLDLRGCQYIMVEEIQKCVEKHAGTIRCLYLDGEDASSQELQRVIEPIKEFEEIGIYYG